jgi:hypothetical protein
MSSKHTKEFYEQLRAGQQPTLLESIREAARTLKEAGGQLWDGMKPMFDHGRTEAAAAQFAGHAHVMYMKGLEGIEQGQDLVRDEPQKQQEISGREM